MKKIDIGRGEAEFNITFMIHGNCILDELPSNIYYIYYNLNLLMILMSN